MQNPEVKPSSSTSPRACPETAFHVLDTWPPGLAPPPPSPQKVLNLWDRDGCPAGVLGSQESKQKSRGMRERAERPSLNLSPRQPLGCLEPPACQALAPQSQKEAEGAVPARYKSQSSMPLAPSRRFMGLSQPKRWTREG